MAELPTHDEIAAIRERRAKVHGPWKIVKDSFTPAEWFVVEDRGPVVVGPSEACLENDDYEFIANAPADIDTLLSALDAVNQHLGTLLAVIHRDGGHYQAIHGDEKAVEDALVLWHRMKEKLDIERSAFKNFHRSLCYRFGCEHDEVDWKRDQCSLEEWIAKKLDAVTAERDASVAEDERLRESGAKLYKAIKRGFGYKNWPEVEGDVHEWIRSKVEAELTRLRSENADLTAIATNVRNVMTEMAPLSGSMSRMDIRATMDDLAKSLTPSERTSDANAG